MLFLLIPDFRIRISKYRIFEDDFRNLRNFELEFRNLPNFEIKFRNFTLIRKFRNTLFPNQKKNFEIFFLEIFIFEISNFVFYIIRNFKKKISKFFFWILKFFFLDFQISNLPSIQKSNRIRINKNNSV